MRDLRVFRAPYWSACRPPKRSAADPWGFDSAGKTPDSVNFLRELAPGIEGLLRRVESWRGTA